MSKAHLYIYNQIGDSFWEYGTTANSVLQFLQDNADATQIVLHINSPGGSVYEGYTIYNLLKSSGKKVTAQVEGICASIATLIAMAADKIEMLPLAQWLVHNPFTYIEGDAEELEKAAEQLRQIEDQIISVYVARTGKTEDEIRNLMDEDKFLTAEQALEMGFVDSIGEALKAVAFYKVPHPTNATPAPAPAPAPPVPTPKPVTNNPKDTKVNKLALLTNFITALFSNEAEPETTPPANSSTPEDTTTTNTTPNVEAPAVEAAAVVVEGEETENATEEEENGENELTAANARIAELEQEVETLKAAKAKATVPGGGKPKNTVAEQPFAEGNANAGKKHPLDGIIKG